MKLTEWEKNTIFNLLENELDWLSENDYPEDTKKMEKLLEKLRKEILK